MSAPETLTPEAAVRLVGLSREEIERQAALVRSLLYERRILFDQLIAATKALKVAENHLGRSSDYVMDLIRFRAPVDAVARSVEVLEEVAGRG